MFFEASRFGCSKTIFDETKVTYNIHSCVISGMSREIIKMDGRDCKIQEIPISGKRAKS